MTTTTCTPRIQLSINATTKASGADCGTGNLNCGMPNPVNCCDTAQIGARPKRENVRQQMHDYILLKLGAPVHDLELDEQQLDVSIDEALDVWEDYAPRDFYTYHTFQTIPGKSVYKMPPEIGHIRQVYYKEMAQFAFQASDLDGAIPVEYFYPGGAYSSIQGGLIDPIQPIWGRMGEWTLYKQYEQMYSRISSNLGGWEWVGGRDTIKLYPIPCKPQHVIVHYLPKCFDWDCNYQSIREGGLASAMMILGEIRSKYQNIPGPQGGTVLNGQDILNRGQQMWDKWEERLITRYGDILPIIVG